MNQRGFTLLEMIIGITLLGFILMLLYGGLHLGVRSWDSGERLVESTSRQTIVSDFLHRLLARTYPLHWIDDDGKRTLAFSGEKDRMYFTAPIPARLGVGGVQMLELADVKEDGDGELLFRWNLPDPKVRYFDFPDEKNRVVLAKGLDKVEFAYYGAAAVNEEPSWHDEWHSDTALPQLVRLALTEKGGEAWPAIVVDLKVSADAGCLWDDFYKRCM